MIANLLEQANIFAQVDGEYLQGGVGELQAFGLVKVRVNADDFERAREIVGQWEASQSKLKTDQQERAGSVGYPQIILAFVLGVIVGVLLAA